MPEKGENRRQIRRKLFDAVIIASVPIFLTIVFFLPANVKENMILHRDFQNGYDLFLSHYVHEEPNHLVWNILLYLVASYLLYSFLSKLGKPRLFNLIFAINCLILPFILSAIWIPLNKFIFTFAQRTYGFSGIVSAFIGSLVFAYILFLKRKLGIDSSYAYISSLMLVVSLFVIIYFKFLSLEIGILLVLFTLVVFGWAAYRTVRSVEEEAKLELIRYSGKPRLVNFLPFFLYLLIILFSINLFPAQLTQGKAMTNIAIHYFGFILGICFLFGLAQIYEG